MKILSRVHYCLRQRFVCLRRHTAVSIKYSRGCGG